MGKINIKEIAFLHRVTRKIGYLHVVHNAVTK